MPSASTIGDRNPALIFLRAIIRPSLCARDVQVTVRIAHQHVVAERRRTRQLAVLETFLVPYHLRRALLNRRNDILVGDEVQLSVAFGEVEVRGCRQFPEYAAVRRAEGLEAALVANGEQGARAPARATACRRRPPVVPTRCDPAVARDDVPRSAGRSGRSALPRDRRRSPANTKPPARTGVAVPRRVSSGTWLSYDQRYGAIGTLQGDETTIVRLCHHHAIGADRRREHLAGELRPATPPIHHPQPGR